MALIYHHQDDAARLLDSLLCEQEYRTNLAGSVWCICSVSRVPSHTILGLGNSTALQLEPVVRKDPTFFGGAAFSKRLAQGSQSFPRKITSSAQASANDPSFDVTGNHKLKTDDKSTDDKRGRHEGMFPDPFGRCKMVPFHDIQSIGSIEVLDLIVEVLNRAKSEKFAQHIQEIEASVAPGQDTTPIS